MSSLNCLKLLIHAITFFLMHAKAEEFLDPEYFREREYSIEVLKNIELNLQKKEVKTVQLGIGNIKCDFRGYSFGKKNLILKRNTVWNSEFNSIDEDHFFIRFIKNNDKLDLNCVFSEKYPIKNLKDEKDRCVQEGGIVVAHSSSKSAVNFCLVKYKKVSKSFFQKVFEKNGFKMTMKSKG